MEGEKSRFSEAEIVIGGLFTLGLDGLCALFDLTGIGLGVSPVIQSFATLGVSAWEQSKNSGSSLKLGREMGKCATNLLPIAPTVTIIFLMTAILHNRNNPVLG